MEGQARRALPYSGPAAQDEFVAVGLAMLRLGRAESARIVAVGLGALRCGTAEAACRVRVCAGTDGIRQAEMVCLGPVRSGTVRFGAEAPQWVGKSRSVPFCLGPFRPYRKAASPLGVVGCGQAVTVCPVPPCSARARNGRNGVDGIGSARTATKWQQRKGPRWGRSGQARCGSTGWDSLDMASYVGQWQ